VLFSAFRLRSRCPVLWTPLLKSPALADTPGSDSVTTLVPAPTFGKPVSFTLPFKLKDVEHPKIPVSLSAKKSWTTAMRKAILSRRPYTIRSETDFNNQVMSMTLFSVSLLLPLSALVRAYFLFLFFVSFVLPGEGLVF
jgi:hypothetical protein